METKTDRQLLELAAKAYADPLITKGLGNFTRWIGRDDGMDCDVSVRWNPLLDDGDAFRLAVKLNIDIQQYKDHVICWYEIYLGTGEIYYNEDPYAATRRAIVLAAARIGESK